MILEVAILDVLKDQTAHFENDFRTAEKIITSMPGFINHELLKCIEKPNRYILLVKWNTLEDHTKGFRGSEQYLQWKKLLHKYYDPFPTVEHYENF